MQLLINVLVQIYNEVPISPSISLRGSLLKADRKIAISSGLNGQGMLGTSTVTPLSITGGPFQSIPKSVASS